MPGSLSSSTSSTDSRDQSDAYNLPPTSQPSDGCGQGGLAGKPVELPVSSDHRDGILSQKATSSERVTEPTPNLTDSVRPIHSAPSSPRSPFPQPSIQHGGAGPNSGAPSHPTHGGNSGTGSSWGNFAWNCGSAALGVAWRGTGTLLGWSHTAVVTLGPPTLNALDTAYQSAAPVITRNLHSVTTTVGEYVKAATDGTHFNRGETFAQFSRMAQRLSQLQDARNVLLASDSLNGAEAKKEMEGFLTALHSLPQVQNAKEIFRTASDHAGNANGFSFSHHNLKTLSVDLTGFGEKFDALWSRATQGEFGAGLQAALERSVSTSAPALQINGSRPGSNAVAPLGGDTSRLVSAFAWNSLLTSVGIELGTLVHPNHQALPAPGSFKFSVTAHYSGMGFQGLDEIAPVATDK